MRSRQDIARAQLVNNMAIQQVPSYSNEIDNQIVFAKLI